MHYLIPLVLTIIIELAVAYLLGFRNKSLLFGIVIINILTNPTLNYIVSHTLDLYLDFGMYYIIFLEAAVVVIEFLMLKLAFRSMKEPFFNLSLVMNGSSFLLGILLLWR